MPETSSRQIVEQISRELRLKDVSRLGEGGFAEIYRAYDPHLRRFVALKLLMARQPEYVERMFREARAQAKIRHEGICQIYQVGWLGSIPYLAMQLIDGEDLATTAPTLSFDQKLDVAGNICRALNAAHDQGLVHRDLKPSNIMVETVEERLRPYVVDFGLVWENDNPGLTGSGRILGTPGYMAPEQVEGRHCGVLTDIYGLGATFYELFTGSPPYGHVATPLLLTKVLRDEPPPADERNPSVPQGLAAVLARAMAKKPRERYQDVPSLARDLARIRRGESVHAKLPSPAFRWWRRVTRRHVSAVLMAGVLLLCLAAVGVWHWSSERRLQHRTFYKSVAEDIKNTHRSALMSPSHDVQTDIQALRARQDRLRNDLRRYGSLAAGPIHYAIAVGHIQLSEHDTAVEHLQQAWELGFRDPEVALELGRAHALIYRDARWDLGRPTTARRKQRMAELETEHRRPAVEMLEQVRRYPSVAVDEIETLLAWVEGDHPAALQAAGRLRRQAPWQYEHLMMEATILEDQALGPDWADRHDATLRQLDVAGDLLRQAQSHAPSDPRPSLHLCRLMSNRVGRQGSDGVKAPPSEIEASYQDGLAACERALEVDSANVEAWQYLISLHVLWARALTWSGEDGALEVLKSALKAARKAATAAPEDLGVKHQVAFVLSMKAEFLLHREPASDEPAPILAEAIRLLEDVVRQEPESQASWNMLGGLLNHQAIFLHRRNGAGLPAMRRSCLVLEKARALDSQAEDPNYNLSSSYQQLVWLAGFHPASPELTLREWNRQGIEYGLRATELEPQSGWAHNVLGALFIQQGRLAPSPGLSTVQSWKRGFEHLTLATELAPQSVYFRSRTAGHLIEIADWLADRGFEPGPYVDAARTYLATHNDSMEESSTAILEIDLEFTMLRKSAYVGQPINLNRLRELLSEVLAKHRLDAGLHSIYRSDRLLLEAMQAASHDDGGLDSLTNFRRAVAQDRPDRRRWLLGLASILEAHMVDDAEGRRQALADAAMWLDPEQLPQFALGMDEPWRRAAKRLPESGRVPFRLFDAFEPWDPAAGPDPPEPLTRPSEDFETFASGALAPPPETRLVSRPRR